VSLKAIVIGAGIGGLATGIALRRSGVDVRVFERVAELTEVGAGISLWANALHALRLGVGVVRAALHGAAAPLLRLPRVARRIPRANAFVTRSRQVGVIGQFESPLAIRLRNAFFSRLSPRLQANQLARAIGYRV
jgi:hypothetical protein